MGNSQLRVNSKSKNLPGTSLLGQCLADIILTNISNFGVNTPSNARRA